MVSGQDTGVEPPAFQTHESALIRRLPPAGVVPEPEELLTQSPPWRNYPPPREPVTLGNVTSHA